MSTYSDIQQRINTDFLNRVDFGDQTKRSILAAVRHYEKKPWWFNETATALTCSAGQTYVSIPSNLIQLRELRITISSADDLLTRTTLGEINDMNIVDSQGPPTHYTIWRNRFELALIPDSAYSVPCYYIKKLSTLSADNDTNTWTEDFEDVIAYHAAKLMWATVLRNDNEAQKYAILEREALKEVEARNELFKLSSIRPTRF